MQHIYILEWNPYISPLRGRERELVLYKWPFPFMELIEKSKDCIFRPGKNISLKVWEFFLKTLLEHFLRFSQIFSILFSKIFDYLPFYSNIQKKYFFSFYFLEKYWNYTLISAHCVT